MSNTAWIRVPLLLLLLLSGGLSCVSLTFKPLRVDQLSQEKDVIIFRVQLEGPAAPEEYREWSHERILLEELNSSNPFFPGIPVYEVQVVFHDGRKRLATVRWRRNTEEGSVLEHLNTFVHAPYGGRNR
ncbi:MAG TPA: hypothetical protein EYN79_01985 [Planctomycetes bacterium]|nr:hypothetical protein [Planctomycetota bacterium]HIN81060.1 hypothetical protein [Planctomycetota bacterium]